MFFLLADGVVAAVDQVHGLEQLVAVNEGTHENQKAQNIPQPEVGGAELIAQVAALQLAADTGGQVVVPNQRQDTQGQGQQEGHGHEGHGALAVIAAGNDVDVTGDLAELHDAVDTQGDDGQQDVLQQAVLGLQLNGGSSGHGSHILRLGSVLGLRSILGLVLGLWPSDGRTT